jgi:hypothetical protein
LEVGVEVRPFVTLPSPLGNLTSGGTESWELVSGSSSMADKLEITPYYEYFKYSFFSSIGTRVLSWGYIYQWILRM